MARTKQTARKALGGKAPRAPFKRPLKGKAKTHPHQFQLQEQQPNLNQQLLNFAAKFDDQKECQAKAVKLPLTVCQGCGAKLNYLSKLFNKQQYHKFAGKNKDRPDLPDQMKQAFNAVPAKGNKMWICEFCSFINEVPPNIIAANTENVCYQVGEQKVKGEKLEEGNMIFCLDISGSMMNRVNKESTRLSCVKRSIQDEIRRLNVEQKKGSVGLITFGENVHFINHKGTKQLPVACYNSEKDIQHQAAKITKNFQTAKTVKERQKLRSKVEDILTYGCTALGPAALSAIVMAGSKKGSKVVICTDGMANRGVGTIQMNKENPFYQRLAQKAIALGVTVNVITIKNDANCSVKNLGKLAWQTGGAIIRVDPDKLGEEFGHLVEEEIIGTEGVMDIHMCKLFKLKGDQKYLNQDRNHFRKHIGNFSLDLSQMFSFDYVSKEFNKTNNPLLYEQKRMPIQLTMTYTGRTGINYVSVFTDYRQITYDEKQALQGAELSQVMSYTIKKTSQLIRQQKWEEVEAYLKEKKTKIDEMASMLGKKDNLKKFNENIKKLEKIKDSKMMKRGLKKGGKEDSDDEDGSSSEEDVVPTKRARGRGRGGSIPKPHKKRQSKKSQKTYKIQVGLSDSQDEYLLNAQDSQDYK